MRRMNSAETWRSSAVMLKKTAGDGDGDDDHGDAVNVGDYGDEDHEVEKHDQCGDVEEQCSDVEEDCRLSS